MDKKIIYNKIVKLISEICKIKESSIKIKSHFIKDLSFDSLKTMELLICIHETFDIKIPDEDTSQLETIIDIIEYIAIRKK